MEIRSKPIKDFFLSLLEPTKCWVQSLPQSQNNVINKQTINKIPILYAVYKPIHIKKQKDQANVILCFLEGLLI